MTVVIALAALLALLGIPVPAGLPADSVAEVHDSPIVLTVDPESGMTFAVRGTACAPDWDEAARCALPTARVFVEHWSDPQTRCALYHESLHLALGPDRTADPDDQPGWWREIRVLDETRAALGPACPEWLGAR